ncbi:hypothetical protein D3C84_1097920 [compost metagenome]
MGERGLDRADVEAPVLGEFLVFACNHRHFQAIGDLVPRLPGALQVDGFAAEPGFNLALDHQRRERRRHHAKQQHEHNAANGEPEQGFKESSK